MIIDAQQEHAPFLGNHLFGVSMLSAIDHNFTTLNERSDLPLYEMVKAQIKLKVETGEWPTNHRVPSENQIVEMLGVSRMTANRALRELATEGVITRVQGRGSFVAPKKRSAGAMGVRNIAEEIGECGLSHHANNILTHTEISGPDLAGALEVEVGSAVLRSIILHEEDHVPIQLEDRFVNAEVAPDYLKQDFSRITPNAYLTSIAPISRTEQYIEAALPQPWNASSWKSLEANPACLCVAVLGLQDVQSPP